MTLHFPVSYQAIIDRLKAFNPTSYAATRNYTNGNVSYLSPYISRGVVSLPLVRNTVMNQCKGPGFNSFLKELAWREYWQRVWEAKGDEMFADLKHAQHPVHHYAMVDAIEKANTGITAIDKAITLLYESGYMHNHLRMYTASVACNIAKAHWRTPAQWMYYHLLDGDPASNSLSWQWVAGSFAAKKYYCNQDNINEYTQTNQPDSYLNCSYEKLPLMKTPYHLEARSEVQLPCHLPEQTIVPNPLAETVFIYNSFHLNPLWHQGETGERVLLLEPGHFQQFPVNRKVMDFILSLASNIPGIQIASASFADLQKHYPHAKFYFKQHPSCMHYSGIAEQPEYLFPEVSGYFPSFSAYWKKCLGYI